MKGLMIKDAKLLKNQGKLLAVMLVVVAGIMYFATDVNAMFIVGYITIIFAMFTATTISYDEFDNCYLFLMTLPVTRKKYVNEKYLFAMITILIAWCVSMVIATLVMISGKEREPLEMWIGENVCFIFVAWVFTSVMLPVRLKFNAEKARYANLIAMGCVLAVVDIVYQIGKMFPAEMRSNIIDYLNGTGAAGFILICGAVAVAAGVISYLSSRHIMARKEF